MAKYEGSTSSLLLVSFPPFEQLMQVLTVGILKYIYTYHIISMAFFFQQKTEMLDYEKIGLFSYFFFFFLRLHTFVFLEKYFKKLCWRLFKITLL